MDVAVAVAIVLVYLLDRCADLQLRTAHTLDRHTTTRPSSTPGTITSSCGSCGRRWREGHRCDSVRWAVPQRLQLRNVTLTHTTKPNTTIIIVISTATVSSSNAINSSSAIAIIIGTVNCNGCCCCCWVWCE